MANTEALKSLLTPVQRLATSGARAVEVFNIDQRLFVVVPQLARDIPGQAPGMSAGDSNVDTLIYTWQAGRLVEHDTLSVPGGEDAEYFEIGDRRFLATVGVRSGSGPYTLDTEAILYERDDNQWTPFQRLPTFAGKQWRFFSIGSRHFLALAQGVTVEGVTPNNPRESCIFEWDGKQFGLLQKLDGYWGYNWAFITFGGQHYLAYADHVSGSLIYRWQGAGFEIVQRFDEPGGRAFSFFIEQDTLWMVHANLMGETRLFQFDGARIQFDPVQSLGAAGGRELRLVDGAHGLYLVRVCFITGTPHAPQTQQQSQIFLWRQGQGRFELVDEFPTSGGTDAAAFMADGQRYLLVSNALAEDVRFRVDSVLYRFDG
jgi:hypothetical protein